MGVIQSVKEMIEGFKTGGTDEQVDDVPEETGDEDA